VLAGGEMAVVMRMVADTATPGYSSRPW
jgi:hypothetical protein